MAQGAGGNIRCRQSRVFPGLNEALREAVRVFTRESVNMDTRSAQRTHLLEACKQMGKTPKELGICLPEEPIPDLPENGAYLWEWFCELSSGRGNNGFGPLPLSWADMDAWARLTGNCPEPWETAILRSMDGVFLAVCHEEQAKKNPESRNQHG